MTITTADAALLKRLAGRAHAVLIALLVGLRPLIWDGDPFAFANLAWHALVLPAVGLVLIESWAGARPAWRFGAAGALAAALLAVLVPAALRAPVPIAGLATWTSIAVHLACAWYLVQALTGSDGAARARLALAALAAGVAGECLLALVQRLHVLPAMAAAVQRGELAGDAGVSAADLAERIANGGVYGTFTLSNTLAGFLLVAVPPLAGAAWRAQDGPRVLLATLVVAASLVLACTNSKGAWIALLAGGGIAWLWHVRGPWRLAPIALGLAALMAVWTWPALSRRLADSAQVRIGYWTGAMDLVREQPAIGHGLDGFYAHFPRVMPVDAEPTRFAHNEPLDAAVAGGIGAGALLLALLGWLACARLRPEPESATDAAEEDAGAPVAAAVALAVAVPYLAAFGMLDGDGGVGWWPGVARPGGGTELPAILGWSLLIGGVLAVVVLLLRRVPLPPAAALRLGLAALALHCCIDLDLHSAGVIGALVAVAVLANAGGGRRIGVGLAGRACATMLAGALAGALALGAWTAADLGEAEHLARLPAALAKATTPELQAGIAEAVLRESGETDLRTALDRLRQRAWELAAADHELRLKLLSQEPKGVPRLARSAELAAAMPFSAAAQGLWAQDLAQAKRWNDAIAVLRTAIAKSPRHLPIRQHLATCLRRAAAEQPALADALRAEAARIDAEVAELAPRVHFRNRPLPDTATTP